MKSIIEGIKVNENRDWNKHDIHKYYDAMYNIVAAYEKVDSNRSSSLNEKKPVDYMNAFIGNKGNEDINDKKLTKKLANAIIDNTSNDKTKDVITKFADGGYNNKTQTDVLNELEKAEMGDAPKYNAFKSQMRKIKDAVDVIDGIEFTDSSSFQTKGWNQRRYKEAEDNLNEIINTLEKKKNQIISLSSGGKRTSFDAPDMDDEE